MTVYFIGAGPGAADLLTLQGPGYPRPLPGLPLCRLHRPARHARRIARRARASSIPRRSSLDEITAEYRGGPGAGQDVARLHSGDLSIYSAVAEQTRRLDALGIPWEMVPGVPAFAAAAAVLGRELTVPGLAQSLVLTRIDGRASPMPPGETLAAFAATGATLAIHLAIHRLAEVVADAGAALRRGLPGRDRRPRQLAG